jgi:gentisate 1,2-dioxygenase
MSEVRKLREDFHRRLRGSELVEGFAYEDGTDFTTRPYWPLEPKNKMRPHLWRWSEVRRLVMECGDMVGLGRGKQKYDRRVLALTNPGAGGDFTLTGPLFGDIQLIRPGESAPCHRHTPCATRIILEGSGGWTTIAGDRVHVSPGDVVYTGQNPWHDHGNGGQDDFIFLDVLDIPLLFFTGTSAWEFDYAPVTGSQENVNQPASVTDFPNSHYTGSSLRPAFKPAWKRNPADFAHLSFAESRASLERLGKEKGSAWDGIRLELGSTDGGPVGRTVSVHTQWIRPRESTLTHRHTGAFVFVCTEGKGKVRIEEEIYEFGPKDIFVIPSWHWHSFESVDGCFLHSVSDLSLIQKMHLYREQRKDGHGNVTDSGWTNEAEPFEK